MYHRAHAVRPYIKAGYYTNINLHRHNYCSGAQRAPMQNNYRRYNLLQKLNIQL